MKSMTAEMRLAAGAKPRNRIEANPAKTVAAMARTLAASRRVVVAAGRMSTRRGVVTRTPPAAAITRQNTSLGKNSGDRALSVVPGRANAHPFTMPGT